MREFNSILVPQDRLLPGIHGLRGIAALAVVIYHLVHLGGIKPPAMFDFAGRDFGYSVHLFFILSAYSLMYSTESKINRPNWIPDYFVKRLFRIAPLYYSMVAFELTRQAYSGGITTKLSSIVVDMTFTFGFVPFSNFIWGGWSVGVEMIFYAIFPVLILTIRTCRSALLLLVVSVIICSNIRSAIHLQHIASASQSTLDWSYFSPASNFCFFVMGIYAYHASRYYKDSVLAIRIMAVLAVTIISGLMFFGLGKSFHGDGRWDLVIWGVAFTALCIWQSVSPSRFIANRVLEYLGERSFSIYLLHPVVIYFATAHLVRTFDAIKPYLGLYAFFVCAALILTVILVLAEFTYTFIEVPGIKLGRKLTTPREYVLKKTAD